MNKILKKYRKAKGFTLVELLIVIIIIGILAGMMMLSTGAATDKAEATKIVSDMRNVKAAAIMCYADYNTWPVDPANKASVDKYLDSPLLATNDKFTIEGDQTACRVQYNGTSTASGIKDKLKAMQSTAGLSVSGDLFSIPLRKAD